MWMALHPAFFFGGEGLFFMFVCLFSVVLHST